MTPNQCAVLEGYERRIPARVIAQALGTSRTNVSRIAYDLRGMGLLAPFKASPRFYARGVTPAGLHVTVASDSKEASAAHLAALCV